MYRKGHIGIGLLFYAPFAFVLVSFDMASIMAFGLVGTTFWSFAPDFDMEMPFVSHRGITHTFLAAGVAGLLTAAISVYLALEGLGGSSQFVLQPNLLAVPAAAGFGFTVGSLGVISHLAGDILTPMGIQPLKPFSNQKYTLDLVYARNELANQALMAVGSGALIGAFILATGAI